MTWWSSILALPAQPDDLFAAAASKEREMLE